MTAIGCPVSVTIILDEYQSTRIEKGEWFLKFKLLIYAVATTRLRILIKTLSI